MATLMCRLPGGYFDEHGEVHREVEFTPITGREEEFLADRLDLPNAALVTHVLSRCVRRIGSIQPVTEAVARGLLVGDRQYLMLKLREATFGNEVRATLVCPRADCAKRIDIDFLLDQIPVRELADSGPIYTLRLDQEDASPPTSGRSEIAFRLPTGEDQEFAAAAAESGVDDALELLASRCIQSIDEVVQPSVDVVTELEPALREEIDRAMDSVAPGPASELRGVCPGCGREFVRAFDLPDFVFAEMKIGRERLYREVHYLAYHYNWSETEILNLTRNKRRMYIEILSEEIDQANGTLF